MFLHYLTLIFQSDSLKARSYPAMEHSLILCQVLQLSNSLNAKPVAKLHALGVTLV